MRIAILSAIYPFRGGIAQFNGAMFRAIEKEGHDIKAFTFSRQYPKLLYPGESQYVTPDEKVDEVPSEAILDTANPISYYSTAKQILEWKPDLILMKFWLPYFGPSLGTVAKKLKHHCKIVTILDNVIPHEKRPFDKTFTKYFLKQNHGFVCMSESVQKDLDSWHSKENSLVIPHPIYDIFGSKKDKTEAREKLGLPQDKKLILYFGYIRDYKGLDLLIDSLKLLPDDVHLIIAGESYSGFSQYHQQIEKQGLQSRTHIFNRYIKDEEISLFYSAADVAGLTYKSATQSGVTGIAIHFNLPLVVTNVGGLTEMVKHDVNGRVAQQVSVEAIAQEFNIFFEENKSELYQGEMESLKDALSWKTFVQKVIAFAEELPSAE